LVTEGENLDGELAPGPEEGEAGKNQGAEEVQHGCGAWSGGAKTSTITHWYGFSGGTGRYGPARARRRVRGEGWSAGPRQDGDAHGDAFDVLVVGVLDRFGRSMVGNLQTVLDLDRCGV
jgi:hypothetical protein